MRESEYLAGQEHLVGKLRLIPAFHNFDDQRLNSLLSLSKVRTYQAQEEIIQEGRRDDCMYILISGSVKVTKHDETIVRLRRAGDIFGEMGMLDVGPRSATVKALQPTTCLALDSARLKELPEDGGESFHAAIYRMFAQILAYRLRVTTEQLLETRKELEKVRHGK